MILVLNSGSSSLKFALLDPSSGQMRLTGLAERLGTEGSQILIDRVHGQDHERHQEDLEGGAHAEAVARVLRELHDMGLYGRVQAIGHRVVHGGEAFQGSVLLTPEVEQAIRKCVPLAPLHNPANLIGIEAARNAFPNLPHVAVFDTAFHQGMGAVEYRYAVPEDWYTKYGVRRYGFHGTSHQYVCEQAVQLLDLDPSDFGMITAHLGNGSSVTSIQNGRSVDTSMGMTPLGGLVMGTRSGDLDPSLIEYMVREAGMTIEEVTEALNKKSGLLGLSGLTNDMRELEAAAAEGHEGALLAINKFVYRLAQTIAAYAIGLKRFDALVFTGGIGENSCLVRLMVLKRLHSFGISVSGDANQTILRGRNGVISDENSKVLVAVVPTNEELMIARQTLAVLDVEGESAEGVEGENA